MNIKHFFRLLITLSLLGSALFVPVQGAQAVVTHPVIDLRTTPGGDRDVILDSSQCSLRQAIIAINRHSNYDACVADSTTTTIILPNTPIKLTVTNKPGSDPSTTGDLNITASMSIIGNGLPNGSGVYWPDGARWDRVFYIGGGAVVNMSGFKIWNGNALKANSDGDGGGILNMGGLLTLTHMTLDNNDAEGDGGAIASFSYGSSLTLNGVNITNNNSVGGSGGILHQGKLLIENSYFDSNVSSVDKATLNYANGTENVAGVINNTTFSNNDGHGISNSIKGRLILSYLTMVGSRDSALFLNAGTWTYLRDSILSNNGRDCKNLDTGSGNFVDGGYNIINPVPISDDFTCIYNNGQPDGNTYHTEVMDPGLSLVAEKIGSNYTYVYSFDQASPIYNYHGVNEAGICVSPSLPAGVTPPNGIVIPALPGYDQYLGPRPTNAEGDSVQGCDVGAYEAGAYLVKPHVFLPSVQK